MSSIFGTQQQNTSQGASSGSSYSANQAYPMLSSALGGTVGTGTSAGNQLANMLGLNGSQGQNQGFQDWQNSTGYQFGLNQGTQAITGSAAAKGLEDSGATGKALTQYGQNYANTQYQNYINPLQSLLSSGLQAGSVISGAGNTSQSQNQSTNTSQGSSSNKQGLAGMLGGLLSNGAGGAG